MQKILIVEDDEKIARVIQLELEFESYEVSNAYTGKEALDKYEEDFDLILLDVMIPELNGLEVLRRIRQKDEAVRIIMLTARDAVMDKVGGLDSGANDYMTKPFEIEELLARIRAQLKQSEVIQNSKQEEMTIKNIKVLPSSREVFIGGEDVYLTQKEYDLFFYLLSNKNQVLSREQIIESVWGYDYFGDTNTVDVYVRYLRKKIDQNSPSVISSVRGIGYMIKD
ncbi:response regulator transcription factor [Lacicoccus qingdaonensis]|uniref:DNA-binding response regulator, OmpR family, contains REC and winged-helix (WHTH) domain n=1 Tax=Lacicoccus qingdaonensis TaxID=576118 RepID=A0A1G9BQD3_9BACL|nr:response regulator transcription factor [Salinicoccus qingdaonensis]SDK41115.1 DNA-binding response regulator, OmpR family, contains REC and winged-helix (wHTH) domain [Salinicoccus qingdaonensis]